MKKILYVIFLASVTLFSCSSPELQNTKVINNGPQVKVLKNVTVTAYTASADECGKNDSIGAYNIKLWPGTVACNFLPKGTLVRIPSMFGEKVFIKLDKMKVTKFNNVDVYVNSKRIANECIGKAVLDIEVVGHIDLDKKQLASR